jgi:hypothetical protein
MLQRRKAARVLLMIIACSPSTMRAGDSPPSIISIPDFGIRYTPPPRMVDKTSNSATKAREHAASYSIRMAETLLEMASNDDDTSSDWHQLVLFIFPRAQFSQLDDAAAAQKINAAMQVIKHQLSDSHRRCSSQVTSSSFSSSPSLNLRSLSMQRSVPLCTNSSWFPSHLSPIPWSRYGRWKEL